MEPLTVDVDDHESTFLTHLVRPQRLSPDVEVVAHRIGALHRRLDVDGAVGRVAMHPVVAAAADYEGSLVDDVM
jgi:hypothetical protein